jgi:hypothetical protein
MLFRATILAALAAAVYGQAVAPPDGCLVCGDGNVVTLPDAIFSFPGYPASPCSTLQEAGLTGQIPLSQCSFLPGLISPVCACAPGDLPVVVAPTPAPVASNNCPPVPASGCSVCGPDLCISNPDAIFSFPGQASAPCGTLQAAGLTGLIPSDQCPFLPSLVGVCDCGTDGVPVAAPTKAPTGAPVTPVTPAPTGAPVTPAPTGAPVTPAPTPDGETAAPTTLAPTEAPTTPAPTEAPTTLAPVPAPTTAPVPAPTPFPVFIFTPAPFFSVPTTSDGKKGKNMMGGGGGGGGGMSGKKRALRENSDIRGN